ncbi:MAG: alpha/beta hydrolase [Gammaproteobacteria bacterium]|nr:alpha/beta hydrolase [Gammaproteobacteria bacterium]
MQASGYLKIGSVSLEYQWIASKAEAAALLLLHEGLGCVDMWKEFPQALAKETGLGVFAYSRRGYGRSDTGILPRPASYMHDEARLLDELLALIPAKSFILVGHSDGASIASIYAGSHPQYDIDGLVLLAPHFFVEDLSIESIAKVKKLYQESDLRERLRKYHGEQVDNAFLGWNDVWLSGGFRQWDIKEYLPRILVPTLIIQGEDDEYGSEAQVKVAQELIAAPVTVRMFPNCGHSPHSQSKEETLLEINRFCDSQRK